MRCRLLVAVHIGQNPSKTNLSLRHTTLMPNIHGFSMMMSLLFCPTMEAKPTSNGKQFAAILCGLGVITGTRRSLYPQHDVCLHLDTELTEADLDLVSVNAPANQQSRFFF